ncbi:malonate decarboxylase holo-ACP synthase [Brevibacillus nitrificans]|uniref:malonate decarboxylase holo-ACP synthase n=1 Tax=Brevibacillus nitrificans TaxID=651560 RepID=UPI00263162BC|nr:malonate decarboxylase holo-ACP synthase [Brevibacillus nitrificans]MED1796975.1 malonate decarboxylase holo-ACP synthase [Brevibacillus nitrificans]
MGVIAHDIVKLHPEDIVSLTSIPDWAHHSLRTAPFVVVRRVPIVNELVPIGIRGSERNQRYGAFLPRDKIVQRITPEQLAERKEWRTKQNTSFQNVWGALEVVDAVLGAFKLAWGPTGSVGFELACHVPSIKLMSDLDIVVRVPEVLDRRDASEIYRELCSTSVRVDVQLDTPSGVIALSEFVHSDGRILVRSEKGPELITNPWRNINSKSS